MLPSEGLVTELVFVLVVSGSLVYKNCSLFVRLAQMEMFVFATKKTCQAVAVL